MVLMYLSKISKRSSLFINIDEFLQLLLVIPNEPQMFKHHIRFLFLFFSQNVFVTIFCSSNMLVINLPWLITRFFIDVCSQLVELT